MLSANRAEVLQLALFVSDFEARKTWYIFD